MEAADDPRLGVGKEWEFDFVPRSKVLEDCRAVIADGCQFDSLFFKSLFRILQLHELRFAEGSPVGGPEEEQNRTVRSLQCFVGLLMAKLIPG